MTKVPFGRISLALGLAIALAPAATVHAGAYAGNKCISAKQKAAAAKCAAVFKAWAAWETSQDGTARDAAIAAAAAKFSAAWTKAETKATAQGADCAATTETAANVESLIDTTIETVIVAAVNGGLTLPGDGKCGGAILKAAGKKCAAFLKADSSYIAKLSAGKTKRDAARTKASTKFSDAFAKAMPCPTTSTAATVEPLIDALVADVVTDTTVSPSVDDTQFTTILGTNVTYNKRDLTPLCSDDSPYYYFVKKGVGADANKIVMYYQGGGACWNFFTCDLGIFDRNVDLNGVCTGGTNSNEPCQVFTDCPDQSPGTTCSSTDNPQNGRSGFGDLSNADNPFKDWTVVFTSYCTGDIHFGDVHQDYFGGIGNVEHINHYGYQNARVVEKWAREHFANPDEIVVTGSSAGAYGALFNAPLLHDVWPDSKMSVLADAGNGVITPSFLTAPEGFGFNSWHFQDNLPTKIPGVLDSITSGEGLPAYTTAVAAFFPDVAWAHYTTAYDGSTGGQTGFYNVMLNLGNPLQWLRWWDATCDWHTIMRQQALDTYDDVHATTADNYRYYIGRGSRHTGYGSNPVVYQTDTLNGNNLPALKDWVNSMRARDVGWVNEECVDCETTRPGDPVPSPLEDPFFQMGPDVVIDCTP